MAGVEDLHEPGLSRQIPELDDEQVRARLQNLTAERLVDLVLRLDWSDRVKVIRNSDSARELVQAMPEEEVLLTIKRVGEADLIPVLTHTTPDQLQFILDVELWSRDSLDEEKVRRWVLYILTCGEAKVMELADAADSDLMAIALSKMITLIPHEEGVKPPKGLPSIMPDEFFTILSNFPEDTESIRLLLRILRQWNRDRFYQLLFEAHGSSGTETEEKAFRWRSSRLEEKGLLEFDEAVEIYAYVGEEEARQLAERVFDPVQEREYGRCRPATYLVVYTGSKSFFYRVLTSVGDPDLQNRLRTEIAFSANRLLVADARDIGEVDSIRAALRRLFALVNVGLLFLTGGDKQVAARTLEHVSVRDLFQIGFGRVVDLRSTAKDIARKWWPKWQEEGFALLGNMKEELMRGLMLRVPQYYPMLWGGDPDFRDFETIQEVVATREALDEIAVIAGACFDRLGIPKPHESRPTLEGVLVSGLEDVNLMRILITGFAHFTAEGRFDITPLSKNDVRNLFEKALGARGPGGTRIRPEPVEQFLSWLKECTGYDIDRWSILKNAVADGLKDLETEIGGIESWRDLDPRYARSLIMAGRK